MQAGLGRNRSAETHGKWVAARFEHDSARAAGTPHRSCRCTSSSSTYLEREADDHRAAAPRALQGQRYADRRCTAQAGVAAPPGYEVERGASGQPEIRTRRRISRRPAPPPADRRHLERPITSRVPAADRGASDVEPNSMRRRGRAACRPGEGGEVATSRPGYRADAAGRYGEDGPA